MLVVAGSMWSIPGSGRLWRVERADGEDACYPIEMVEIARDGYFEEMTERFVSNQPEPLRERHSREWKRPQSMKQEIAWFTHRKPTQFSSVEEWLSS